MILTAEQSRLAKGLVPRTGVLARNQWPSQVIPYAIKAGYFTSDQEEVIRSAIAEIQAKTCIQFIIRTNETDYISVTVR